MRAKQSYTEKGSVSKSSDSAGLNVPMKAKQSYTGRGSVSKRGDSAVTQRDNESEAEQGREGLSIHKE
jgi:hypothetical protein